MTSRRRRLVYIASDFDKSIGFEWTIPHLVSDYELSFILLNPGDSVLEGFLKESGVRVDRVTYRGKRDVPRALLQTLRLLLLNRPDVIHAHLFDATLVGLAAAWLLGVKKRVYTRHTSTYHHRYFPHAVFYDKVCNWLATQIISISQATDEVLLNLESVPAGKVRKVHHGYDMSHYESSDEAREAAVRLRWGIPERHPRVGVIARQIHWKGIQHIIPAFREFLSEAPDACLILANAAGPYQTEIRKQLETLPPRSYALVQMEFDNSALYRLFDIYVHVPIDRHCEAFGHTYVEALAAGVPSIFTPSGIAAEFIEDGSNALLVDFENSPQIHRGLVRLWKDPGLRHRLAEAGRRSVMTRFDLANMIAGLKRVYDE